MPQPYTSFAGGPPSPAGYPHFVNYTMLGPNLGTGRPVGLQTKPYLGTIELPDGFIGTAYAVEGDQAAPEIATPVTYSITSGSLPPGLSLSNPSGSVWKISGTPTTAGTYSFALEASNSYGTSTASLSITIHAVSSGAANYGFVS